MKKLRVYCHSFRDGEFINPEGFELIRQAAAELKQSEIVDNLAAIFFSDYPHNLQTAAALIGELKPKQLQALQIPELSGRKLDEIFFHNPGFMAEYEAKAGTDLMLIMRKHLDPKEIARIETESAHAILSCFKHLRLRKTGIAIGHRPYISAAADYLSLNPEIHIEGKKLPSDNSRFANLPEMGHIDFFMD